MKMYQHLLCNRNGNVKCKDLVFLIDELDLKVLDEELDLLLKNFEAS